MNFLPFVFSLLLILSYSFFVSFDKHTMTRKIRTSYLGHVRANRKILSSYEKELYKSFPKKKNKVKEQEQQIESLAKRTLLKQETPPAIKTPSFNQECARLNIWPLIHEEKEDHQILHFIANKLLNHFYGEALFKEKKGFLDAWIRLIKKCPDLPLEKLEFDDPEWQQIYYCMLKGTKKRYPPLLDYMMIEHQKEAYICLFHAHPQLLTVLFGSKASMKIYEEMHKKKMPITQEVIERLCSEVHTPIRQTEIFTLLKLGRPKHKSDSKKILVETDLDTAITLRKDLQIKSS